METINLNGFEYTFTEENEWIYKAVPFSPLKKQPKELPEYKVIEEIEQRYIDEFEKTLANIVKDTTKILV